MATQITLGMICGWRELTGNMRKIRQQAGRNLRNLRTNVNFVCCAGLRGVGTSYVQLDGKFAGNT
jgi:hypothetical protein